MGFKDECIEFEMGMENVLDAIEDSDLDEEQQKNLTELIRKWIMDEVTNIQAGKSDLAYDNWKDREIEKMEAKK